MTKIKTIRGMKGLTQIQLARKAKIAQAYLSEIENGKTPSVHVYKRIAKALGVPVSTLLDEEEEETHGTYSNGIRTAL